jgi:hypothetical protein
VGEAAIAPPIQVRHSDGKLAPACFDCDRVLSAGRCGHNGAGPTDRRRSASYRHDEVRTSRIRLCDVRLPEGNFGALIFHFFGDYLEPRQFRRAEAGGDRDIRGITMLAHGSKGRPRSVPSSRGLWDRRICHLASSASPIALRAAHLALSNALGLKFPVVHYLAGGTQRYASVCTQ